MSYTDNNTIAKEILNDYVQWALGYFWTQDGIDVAKTAIEHLPDSQSLPTIDRNAINYLKYSGTTLYSIPTNYLTIVPPLFVGLKLDVISVDEPDTFYTGTMGAMASTKLSFMKGATTHYVIGSGYHITNHPGQFFGLDAQKNTYRLFQVAITNTAGYDYLTVLKSISVDNRVLFLTNNMKTLKRCCVDSQLLGPDIRTSFCNPFLSDIFGLPSYQCDKVACAFCSNNPKDPACACFSDDPAAIGTGYDTIIHRFMNSNNPTRIGRKCILNACKDSNAYKTAEMLRYDCPHLCTSLLNTKISDHGSIDINNALITVKCGDGKQNFTLGSGPGSGNNGGNGDIKKIKWWGYFLIFLAVLIVIGGIIFVMKKRNKKVYNK